MADDVSLAPRRGPGRVNMSMNAVTDEPRSILRPDAVTAVTRRRVAALELMNVAAAPKTLSPMRQAVTRPTFGRVPGRRRPMFRPDPVTGLQTKFAEPKIVIFIAVVVGTVCSPKIAALVSPVLRSRRHNARHVTGC